MHHCTVLPLSPISLNFFFKANPPLAFFSNPLKNDETAPMISILESMRPWPSCHAGLRGALSYHAAISIL